MKTIDRRRLAAIDIGTNSLHLIVTDIDCNGRNFRILDKEKEMVRLGSGGMKRLSAGAMERGIKTLRRFKAVARAQNAPVRAIATSAVREASNRDEFIRRAKKEAGVQIEVVSGMEEARLIYLGVLSSMPVVSKKILLVDIGGGSTELLTGKNRRILYSASLKLGAVRLTRHFFKHESVDRPSVSECRAHIRELLDGVAGEIRIDECDAVVGTSGTISNIARMIRLRRNYSRPSKAANRVFSRQELFEITDEIIAAKDPLRRAAIKGLDRGRADIIIAGALILKEVFKKFKIKNMTVSKSALREGIVLDTVEAMASESKFLILKKAR